MTPQVLELRLYDAGRLRGHIYPLAGWVHIYTGKRGKALWRKSTQECPPTIAKTPEEREKLVNMAFQIAQKQAAKTRYKYIAIVADAPDFMMREG